MRNRSPRSDTALAAYFYTYLNKRYEIWRDSKQVIAQHSSGCETTELAAASTRHVIVIEVSLVAPSHIGLIYAALFFAHIRKHFAISTRTCVNGELPVS